MSVPFSGLLALPVEIRGRILTELLAARNVRYSKGGGYYDYAFEPAVFRVNKQLHAEAVENFRHQNTLVTVCTPWQQAEEHVAIRGQIPILIKGDAAKGFCHSRMMAEVELTRDIGQDFGAKTYFVLSSEDLHGFCRLWYYSDLSDGGSTGFNSYLRLTLDIQVLPSPSNPDLPTRLSRTAQAQLIEPFTMVKKLSRITINGPLDESVREDFYRKEKEPHPTPEECLDECDRVKEEGNKAINQKEYFRAKELYEQSFKAMHILVAGRVRQVWADMFFDKTLREGRFKGQDGTIVRLSLRIKLVANMIEVYLKLNQPEEAKFWGLRSINIVRERFGEDADRPKLDFPAAGAWGKVYYRTGRACQLLGEEDDARQLIRIAADWLPNDIAVQQARAETALRLG